MMCAPEGLYWRVRGVVRRGRARRRAAPRGGVPPEDPPPPRPGAVQLEVRGVSKAFIGLQALADVSFDVREGEILGDHRPERRGQDHALQRAQRLPAARPRRGPVLGEPITGLRPSAICRRGVGRTFQVVRSSPR